MLPGTSSSSKAYPDKGGVVLAAGEGVLSFAGFSSRTPDLDDAQVREHLDAALHAGVIRRGLVLQCQTCEQKQFQTIDKISQVWTCVRCDSPGDLDRKAWKQPDDEPIWFYDLHPVGRQLLREHGEVPALLSALLSTEAEKRRSTFYDVEEIEFVQGDAPQVEVDLVAYSDDTLILAECKSTDRISDTRAKARDEIRKKCQAAMLLKADHLVFATTAPSWTASTLGAIQGGVREFTWGPLGPPEVRLITSLGSTPVQRSLADSNS